MKCKFLSENIFNVYIYFKKFNISIY